MIPRRAALLLILAACGSAPARIEVPPVPASDRVASDFSTIEVLNVSLPSYAEGEEIFVATGPALEEAEGAVWADDPPRAITLDLVRALSEITGATVAPEPWPFELPAEARLDVRVAAIVAEAGGQFTMRGQYYVASQDESGRDASREFRIGVPLASAEPAAIAAARGAATVALAREIASNGL